MVRAVAKDGLEPRLGAEVADASVSRGALALELVNDVREPLERADGRSGDDSRYAALDVADDGVATLREPEAHPRVHDLIGRGVPPMCENQRARPRELIGAAG